MAVLFGLALATLVADVPSARAAPEAKKQRKLSAHERVRLRRALRRQVRRNPGAVLERKFLRRAALAEFRLPMSVRLRKPDGQGGWQPKDDQLEIAWDDATAPWPFGAPYSPAGIPAAPQTVLLAGSFTLESIFNGGDTSGYGEVGATETIVGNGIQMQADPFTISEFDPLCADGPQLATAPDAAVEITSARPRFGVMNLFSGEIRGTLSLRMSFASAKADSCGALPGLTETVVNSSAPPMPLRFSGKFTISPAITPDGKMRFGKIDIDDAVTPQLSTFAYVRACTDQPAGVAPCNPQQFPARLKLKKLTADVLLGDVLP